MTAKLAIAVLCAAAAWGQTTTAQSVSHVFSFTYAQTPVAIQEITNAVRTIPEITQATPDPAGKTLTVTATPARLAMATWIVSTLDQPAPANQATEEYRPEGSANDVVRVVYRSHPGTMQSLQEIVNAVRTIPEMTKVFPYTGENAIVMRGANSQMAAAEWLFHQLDLPAGIQPAQSPSAHLYVSPDPISPSHFNDSIVQVLFLSHPWSLQSMQQIANTVRTIPQLTKVFQYSAAGAVAVRGPASTLALAAWLFGQLDRAPQATAQSSTPAPQEFQLPGGADDVTQVFYLPAATTVGNFQGIVRALRDTRGLNVFPEDLWNAVALRGTAAQIAAADSLIKQIN